MRYRRRAKKCAVSSQQWLCVMDDTSRQHRRCHCLPLTKNKISFGRLRRSFASLGSSSHSRTLLAAWFGSVRILLQQQQQTTSITMSDEEAEVAAPEPVEVEMSVLDALKDVSAALVIASLVVEDLVSFVDPCSCGRIWSVASLGSRRPCHGAHICNCRTYVLSSSFFGTAAPDGSKERMLKIPKRQGACLSCELLLLLLQLIGCRRSERNAAAAVFGGRIVCRHR